ncbi:uncharacterized protein [Miscanthus floridulus]|uniref:uncharacterized protein n=1 Tax=Miscanthus floridulus TaxID=154761 RepID=UPI0034581DBD
MGSARQGYGATMAMGARFRCEEPQLRVYQNFKAIELERFVCSETFRAIDVGLSALKQYLVVACSRASSAGFNTNSLPELLFANRFGAQSAELEHLDIILEGFGGIWRNLDESGGICERKTLFRMKKEVDQAGFKGTQTGMYL